MIDRHRLKIERDVAARSLHSAAETLHAVARGLHPAAAVAAKALESSRYAVDVLTRPIPHEFGENRKCIHCGCWAHGIEAEGSCAP